MGGHGIKINCKTPCTVPSGQIYGITVFYEHSKKPSDLLCKYLLAQDLTTLEPKRRDFPLTRGTPPIHLRLYQP